MDKYKEEPSAVSGPPLGRSAVTQCLSMEDRLGYILESRKEDQGTKFKRLLVTAALIIFTTCVVTFPVSLLVVNKVANEANIGLIIDKGRGRSLSFWAS